MPNSTLLESENTLLKSPSVTVDSPVVALIRSRQHLQANPENTTALFEQAVALCRLGQWEPALDAWEQVTRLEPGNAFAHFNRGIIHLEREQWQLAEQAFEAALRYAPEHAEAHFGLGMAYARQERYEPAYAAWQEALRLNPTHPEAHANLTMLAQMSATEVESLNFGSAQTMQFDCIASPFASSERAHGENSEDAQDSPLTLFGYEPSETEERRIKLPPLTGPPLGSIADAVVAAQEAQAHDGNDTLAPKVSEAAPVLEARSEPTLKLDSKALKREHARLAVNGASLLRQRHAAGWLRSLAVTGSAVIAAVALTLWGTGHFRAPATSPSTSEMAIVTPQNPSATLPAPADTPQPVSTRVVSPAPVVIEPNSPVSASAVRASTFHARAHAAVRKASASHQQAEAKSERRPRGEEISHPSRRHSESSESADARPALRRPQARTPQAQQARPRQVRADEDTFAATRRATHANSAEEWTDRIP